MGVVFDLDEASEVYLPSGGSIELIATAEIIRAKTWVFEDPDLVKLEITTLKPRSQSKNELAGLLNRSAFRISCTRDCKTDETFELTLNYKDLKKKIVLDTKKITVKVTPFEVVEL